MSESVSEAIDLAVESVNDAVVAASPGVGLSVDPDMDELTTELASTREEVVSPAANLDDLEGARDQAERERERLVNKAQLDAKTSKNQINAERYGALSRYHGVLRSVWGIIKAADERGAGHNDTSM